MSMPYLGRTSFLLPISLLSRILRSACQCPISGALHFYKGIGNKSCSLCCVCQCPISGALHFYQKDGTATQYRLECVNALSRAHFISTCNIRLFDEKSRCVNALSRAHFISTILTIKLLPERSLCQCPISGALHFYYGKC